MFATAQIIARPPFLDNAAAWLEAKKGFWVEGGKGTDALRTKNN